MALRSVLPDNLGEWPADCLPEGSGCLNFGPGWYRSGQLIFVLSNWMADPKCTSEVRNRWLDIWEQARHP